MQEKNIVTNAYWSDSKRFADIINVGMFHAKKILSAEQLREKDGYLRSLRDGEKSKKGIQKYRDIVKEADFHTTFVIIGIENQSDIHYAVPVKIMGYDYLGYDEQVRNLKKEHWEKKDLTGAEFVSGFGKDDKLSPVCTLVLYYGEEEWDGPTCLKDILNFEGIPSEIQEKVADYPIHIIDVRRFEESEKLETDARIFFGFMQRDSDMEQLQLYWQENEEEFQNMSEDTFDMISILSKSKGLLEMKEESRTETGGMNMCKALQDMIDAGKCEGRIEGRIEEKRESILEFLEELGTVPEEVKQRILSETDMEQLKKWNRLAAKSNNIEEFVRKM